MIDEEADNNRMVTGESLVDRVPKHLEVWRKPSGMKVVLTKSLMDTVGVGWVYVCDKPHADGDFSYLCTAPWCRCCS